MEIIGVAINLAFVIFLTLLFLALMWWVFMTLVEVGVYLFGLLVDALRYISSFLPKSKTPYPEFPSGKWEDQ